jgi:hypothetical protein
MNRSGRSGKGEASLGEEAVRVNGMDMEKAGDSLIPEPP